MLKTRVGSYDYSHAELSDIGDAISEWMREGLDVYVMLLSDSTKVEPCVVWCAERTNSSDPRARAHTHAHFFPLYIILRSSEMRRLCADERAALGTCMCYNRGHAGRRLC